MVYLYIKNIQIQNCIIYSNNILFPSDLISVLLTYYSYIYIHFISLQTCAAKFHCIFFLQFKEKVNPNTCINEHIHKYKYESEHRNTIVLYLDMYYKFFLLLATEATGLQYSQHICMYVYVYMCICINLCIASDRQVTRRKPFGLKANKSNRTF